MLRFAIISLSTLGVLGVVFFLLVLRAQPAHQATATTHAAITPTGLSSIEPKSGVGPGKLPWFKNFDDKGVLSSEFHADDFTPQKDGSFLFRNVESIYYVGKGQRIDVKGDRGVMYCDSTGPTAGNNLFTGPTSTPHNGTLQHVHIEMFPTTAATRPTQWMDTDNIRFDNDTLQLYTESFTDAQGHVVRAEDVPVAIRGDQYEFDGNGLSMHWDGRHRLEKLVIFHGKRLEIKDPTKLSLPGMAAPETTKQAAVDLPLPEAIVSTDPAAVRLIANKKPPVAADPPIPYRAVFNQDVRITEPARVMATADVMTVDFLQGSSSKPNVAGATPTPKKSASSTPPHPTEISPVIPSAAPASTATAPAVKEPTSKPINGPVTIWWTGPLEVRPIQVQSILPLTAGQSVVKLVGSPAVLTPEGSEVRAATAIYRNPDGAAQLHASPQFPTVTVTQGDKLALETTDLDYKPSTGIATLLGPNELNVLVANKKMNVKWTGQGLLHIIRVPSQPNGVDQIDLAGDVAVTHPLFTLNSQQLKLSMDLIPKPGAKPTDGDEQLKLLTATDDVHCRLMHPGKPTQGIDSDKLVIRTERSATKQTVPREVIADGGVHAFDPEQSITAGHLDALLLAKADPAPATKSADEAMNQAVDLESLYAENAVHSILKSGAISDSEKLRVTTVDGKQKVELWGKDGARLDNKKGSWLQGPAIDIHPAQGRLNVAGAGMMETIHDTATTRPADAPPPKPIHVTWSKSMSLDSAANIADGHGEVTVKNTDAVGTVSTITGDDCHIDLMDAPKDDKKKSTTDPDAMGSAMAGKALKMLTLTGNVIGESELHAPDGSLQRQSRLHGDQLIYDAVKGTAVVPGAGWLLVENHHASDKQATGNLGQMAVSWKKQLAYNKTTQIINIDGDTITGFEKDVAPNDAKKPVTVPDKLYAQHLVITLAKAPDSTEKQNKLQLSQMQATGQVIFLSAGSNFSCDQVDYDPRNGLMTATGHGKTMSADQSITGSFTKLIYDTVLEEVRHVEGSQVKVQR